MSAPSLETRNPLVLRAETAADLMSPHLFSVRERATVPEAVALLVSKGFHAAPVIDEVGRPVGVLSGTDILIHARSSRGPSETDPARACDLMTPAVFAVGQHVRPERVVNDMIALGVHQLFVVDAAGVLVGVVTALDVARHLAAEDGEGAAGTAAAD